MGMNSDSPIVRWQAAISGAQKELNSGAPGRSVPIVESIIAVQAYKQGLSISSVGT